MEPLDLLDPSQLAQQLKDEQKISRDFYNVISSDSFLKIGPRDANGQCKTHTEQLKNDLEEVEALTSRVRDSISVDLSSTRRHSSLLYEYYRQQLELARSIQSTYNIKFTNLFDAMSLMKKCFRDYCQTVHNPEYLAIETIDGFQVNNEDGAKMAARKSTPDDCYEKMEIKKDPLPWVSYELFESMKGDKRNPAEGLFSLNDQQNTQPHSFYTEIVKKSNTTTSTGNFSRPSSILLAKRTDSANLDLGKQAATSGTLISILTASNSRVDEPNSSAFAQVNASAKMTCPKPSVQFVDFENKQTYV